MNLSKSLYIRGLQCPKSLWLKKYKKNILSAPDNSAEAVFKTGNKVGELACKLFTPGEKIEFTPDNYQQMFDKTQQLIKDGVKNIYEAAFSFDGVYVAVDILHINDDGSVEIYEVKSSTWGPKKTKKDIKTYIEDAAVQYYVLRGNGFEVKSCNITLLDKQYIFQNKLEVEKLFTHVDVMEEVIELQEDIPTRLKIFANVLADNTQEYFKEIGAHCTKPYTCDAWEYCWKQQAKIPDFSVFNIFKMGKKPISLYKQGVIEVEDIPEDMLTTEIQKLVVDTWKHKASFIDKESIKHFIDTLQYPIYHLDFETYQDAIPSFDNQRPYQQICFQYSVHIEHDDGTIEHKEFLGQEGTDPREELIKRMIEDIKGNSTVLVYNESFETKRIKEMAEDFPQYADELLHINDRIVDLAIPFKEKWFYDYRLKGKWSIKLVMPILVPHMADAYKKLQLVQNGGDAMNLFPKLKEMDENTRLEHRQALLNYCELDTLSMVEILKKLKENMK